MPDAGGHDPGPKSIEQLAHATHVYGHTRSGEALKLDFYATSGRHDRPLIIMVHGGGFSSGSRLEYATEARYWAEHGWAVATIDYELSGPNATSSPEKAIAALDVALADVEEALAWLLDRAARLGFARNDVVAFGESAGGTVVTALAYFGDGPKLVRAAASASGRSDPRFYHEFGPTDAPLLFVTSEADAADDLEIQRQSCRVAKESGVSCTNLVRTGAEHGLDTVRFYFVLTKFFSCCITSRALRGSGG